MANNQIDFTVDKNNLYKEENITDLKVASIRCLIPVKNDGTPDETRDKMYIGHTQLMSSQGPVPIQARLEAGSLDEAMDKFPSAMEKAMNDMIENARKMQEEHEKAARQEQQSSSGLIYPGR